MPLKYYKNSLNNQMTQQPNDFYHDLQQAFIDDQWDNTSALRIIEEQDDFGLDTYHNIEVWLNKVIGQTTTFAKNGEDYRQVLFKDINKKNVRGLYYRFEDDYWIVDFVNPAQGLSNSITLRRCNNALRIVDPENGSVFAIPCVVDYDMTSPTMLINTNVLTPNNHAIVYVQANSDTMRLFTYNKRFFLNGRVFKLLAYQNALNRDLNNQEPTVLYLDLYFDELHANDNLETQVAYNGDYVYDLTIESNASELQIGSTGYFNATITLNGVQVNREIEWMSSNPDIVTFYKDGKYEVFGNVGDTVTLTATLNGNSSITKSLNVTVVDNPATTPYVTFNPDFDNIRQFENLITQIEVEYNGVNYIPSLIEVSLSETENIMANEYLSIALTNNTLSIECLDYGSVQPIYIKILNETPLFETTTVLNIECLSVFG